MTSPAARATVTVHLDTSNVREELRRAISGAARDLRASVKVDVDATSVRTMQANLKNSFSTAKIPIIPDVKNDQLYAAKIRVKQALGEVKLPIDVNVNAGLAAARIRVKQVMAEAKTEAQTADRESRASAQTTARESRALAQAFAREVAINNREARAGVQATARETKARDQEARALAQAFARETKAIAQTTAREAKALDQAMLRDRKATDRAMIESSKQAVREKLAANREIIESNRKLGRYEAEDRRAREVREAKAGGRGGGGGGSGSGGHDAGHLGKGVDINVGAGRLIVPTPLIAPVAGAAVGAGAGLLGPALGAMSAATPIIAGLIPLLGSITGLLKNNAELATAAGEGWRKFKLNTEDASLGTLSAGVGAMNAALADLEPVTIAVSHGFTNAGHAWTSAFKSEQFKTIFAGFASIAHSGVIESINRSVINVAAGFGNLILAFKPLIPFMTGGLETLTAKFSEWGAGLSGSSGFTSFIEYVKTEGHVLFDIFKQFGTVLLNVLPILSDFGGAGLSALQGVLHALAGFSGNPFGAFIISVGLTSASLVKLFALMKVQAIMTAFRATFNGIAAVFTVSTVGANGLTAALVGTRAVLASLGPAVLVATALAAAFVLLGRGSDGMRTAIILSTAAVGALYGLLNAGAIATAIKATIAFAVAQVAAAGATGVFSAAIAICNGALKALWVVMMANPLTAILAGIALVTTAVILMVKHFQGANDVDNSPIPGSARQKAEELHIATVGLTDAEVQRRLQLHDLGITAGTVNGLDQTAIDTRLALAVSTKKVVDVNTLYLQSFKDASAKAVQDNQDMLTKQANDKAYTEAKQGVIEAIANEAKSARDSSRQIRDSIKSVTDARQNEKDVAVQNAQNIIDAQKKVADAEKSLADAHTAVKKAQVDLTDVRVKAAAAIRDLTAAAEDAKRAQEESRISLIQESQAYDAIMANSSSTDLEKQAALAKLNDAQGAATNATTAAAQAVKERDKAVKDGVDQSAATLAAEQTLTKAHEAEKKAIDDLSQAHKDVGKAVKDAAKASQDAAGQTKTAIEGLATAYENASTARVSAEDAVKKAHDRVTASIQQIHTTALALRDRTIQITAVPVIAGMFKLNDKGDLIFVPSVAPKAGKGSVAPEPSRGGPGVVGHAQKGWRIPGYGGGDTVPILAERGESIIPKHLTPAIAPWAKAQGIPGFAAGGLVGGDQIKNVQGYIQQQDPKPYVWGAVGPGSFDCSGLTGQIWAMLTNHPLNHRYFTTASNFPSFGFKQGTGAFTIGVNPGHHVVGNLAGLPFEAQSTATGIIVGPKATSVTKMAQQWYLPQIAGGFASGGGGTPPSTGPTAAGAATGVPVTSGDVSFKGMDVKKSLNKVIADQVNSATSGVFGQHAPAPAPYKLSAQLTPAFKQTLKDFIVSGDAGIDGDTGSTPGITKPGSGGGAADGDVVTLAMAKAKELHSSRKVALSLIEAGIVESGLRNLNYGDRDSLGFLQQRPSQGWLHPNDISYAAWDYLHRAIGIEGRYATSGRLAQGVQRSAFPDRYDAQEARASQIIKPYGYDRGGYLPPGATMAINNTGRPERVLSHAEEAERTGAITTDQLRQALSGVATVEDIRQALSGMEFQLDERGIVRMVTKGQAYINTRGGRQ